MVGGAAVGEKEAELIDRRQIIVGAAATTVISSMPVVARAVEVADDARKPMQVLFAQLLAQVRA